MASSPQALSPGLGLQIPSLNPLDLGTNELTLLIREHGIVAFTDARLANNEVELLASRLGGPCPHPYSKKAAGSTMLSVVESTAIRPYAAAMFHADLSWRQEPPRYSILVPRLLPPSGGDTIFVDTGSALDHMEERIVASVVGRHATHSYTRRPGARALTSAAAPRHEARHPCIARNPDGRRHLFLNRSFVTGIDDLDRGEVEAVLDAVDEAYAQAVVRCRIRWTCTTCVVWDNLQLVHRGTDDHWPAAREMLQVSSHAAALDQ